jgi:hypothetical protein
MAIAVRWLDARARGHVPRSLQDEFDDAKETLRKAQSRLERAEGRSEGDRRSAHGNYNLDAGPLKVFLGEAQKGEGGLAQLGEDAGLDRDTLAHVLTRNRVVRLSTAEAALNARGRRMDEFYSWDEAKGRWIG